MSHPSVNALHLPPGLLKCIIIWNHKEAITKIPKNTKYVCKLVLNKCKYDSATECLKQLHWLPIEQGIQHKILVITHKTLNRHAPKYIQELINEKQAPSRQLRSRSSGRLLNTSRIRKETFASRSFSYAAPVLWNALLRHLWDETSTTIFRKHLKTYLLNMHSTCKAYEKVSHCVLFIALY